MELRLKRNDKIGLIFFVAFIISTSLIWLFEERFDSDDWKNRPGSRYKMVDDLIESRLLIGTSKTKVLQVLGEPETKSNTTYDYFLYELGKGPSFFESKKEQLLVEFRSNRVEKVAVAE